MCSSNNLFRLSFTTYFDRMSSHVPFLAVRPNEQFSTDPVEAPSGVLVMDKRLVSIDHSAPSKIASRIPSVLRFPLAVISSLGLSALFYTLVANYAGFELAAPARDATESWNVAYFLGWRIVALGFAWFTGLDCKCDDRLQASYFTD